MKTKKPKKVGVFEQLIIRGYLPPDSIELKRSFVKKQRYGNHHLKTNEEREVAAIEQAVTRLMKNGTSLEQAFKSYAPRKGKPGLMKQLMLDGLIEPKVYDDYLAYLDKRNKGEEHLWTDDERAAIAIDAGVRNHMKKSTTLREAYISYVDATFNLINEIGKVQGEEFAKAIRSYQRKLRFKNQDLITDYERYCFSVYNNVRERFAKGMSIEDALKESIEYAESDNFVDKVFPNTIEKAEFNEAREQCVLGGIKSCNPMQKELVRRYRREYSKYKCATDDRHYSKARVQSIVSNAKHGYSNESRTFKILGIDHDGFMNQLYSTNPDLDLRDAEIDHIVPKSMADNEDEDWIVNYHLNFQLLTRYDNGPKRKGANMPTFDIDSEVVSHKNSYVLMVIAYFNYSRYAQYHEADFNITVDRDKQEMKIEQWSEMAA